MVVERYPDEIKVGIADWKVDREPKQIITLGLGSCVGIALYDSVTRIGGLAHIMLPDSTQFQNKSNPAKYADLAIPAMLEEMLKRGARKSTITAKIAGGAQMFNFGDKNVTSLNIGQRNVEMTKKVLQALRIPLIGEHTGENYGRTMIFRLIDGEVLIRAIGRPLISI
ncbi:MAG TPA: chemotaxis protein CheD [Clostridia bacterium]|nr:chemotaxis protein CheD [Clostridia bacterium]